MTDLPISAELAAKLRDMAHKKNRSLEELLGDFVEQQSQSEKQPNIVPAKSLLALAEMAEQLNLRSGRNDISERFDEYVAQAIADHVKDRSENG